MKKIASNNIGKRCPRRAAIERAAAEGAAKKTRRSRRSSISPTSSNDDGEDSAHNTHSAHEAISSSSASLPAVFPSVVSSATSHDIPPNQTTTVALQLPPNPEPRSTQISIALNPVRFDVVHFRPVEPYATIDARKILEHLGSLFWSVGTTMELCMDERLFGLVLSKDLIRHLAFYVTDNPWEVPSCKTGPEINLMLKSLEAKVKKRERDDVLDEVKFAANFAVALKKFPIRCGEGKTFLEQARSLMTTILIILDETKVLDLLIADFKKNNRKGGSLLGTQVFNLIMKQLPEVFQTWIKGRIEHDARSKETDAEEFLHPMVILAYLHDPPVRTIPWPLSVSTAPTMSQGNKQRREQRNEQQRTEQHRHRERSHVYVTFTVTH